MDGEKNRKRLMWLGKERKDWMLLWSFKFTSHLRAGIKTCSLFHHIRNAVHKSGLMAQSKCNFTLSASTLSIKLYLAREGFPLTSDENLEKSMQLMQGNGNVIITCHRYSLYSVEIAWNTRYEL